jgi:predicted Zn-dependent protease
VQQALALAPVSPLVQRSAAGMALRQGNPSFALSIARNVQLRDPDRALGWRLEGDARAQDGDWPGAAKAYRQAVARADRGDAPARLHWALLKSGQAAEAARFESEWSTSHASDARFASHAAEQALLASDWPRAEARLKRVLELRPDDASAHNNLALVLTSQGRPGALAHAERAALLAPDRPEVLDTMASVLHSAGRTPEALAWQQRAVARAPANPGLRLHLARLLIAAGQREAGRRELETLSRLGPAFSEQRQVQALLAAP